MASTAFTGTPTIASSNRSRDLEPYCQRLFSEELSKFIDIFPSDFPQGDRDKEEAFLRTYFSDDEISVHGGADGAGNGFRFLKAVWMWAANWNLIFRVPAVAAHWMRENQTILNDPNMRKSLFEPEVQPGTFFNESETKQYGEKLLKVVIRCIQEQLRDSPPLSGNRIPLANLDGSSPPHDASSNHNTAQNSVQPPDVAAQAHNNVEENSPRTVDLQPQPLHSQVQSGMQRTSPSINQVQSQQYPQASDAVTSESNKRGGHSTRGRRGSPSYGSSGDRGARAGGKSTCGPQDARFQSPALAHQNYGSHGGASHPAAPPMQTHTMPAGSFAPNQEMPHMLPGSHFAGQVPPGNVPYGYHPTEYQVQFQQHMHGPMNFSPGFLPQHLQPFGDRSNFPSTGRKSGDESRLFDPDEKFKQPKHGSGGGSMRGNKSRGHPTTHRGGNRGHNAFGQTGGNYSRENRTFHRHTGSEFYGLAGSGRANSDNRFSMTPQEKQWQPPYCTNDNGLTDPGHYQAPSRTTSNVLPSTAALNAPVPKSTESSAGLTQVSHDNLPHYAGGHHRALSTAMPCNPTECNKYAIGDQCTYAKKLLIFQVPMGMKEADFIEHFSKYGPVEEAHLGNIHDPSLSYPGLRHRSPSWVRFSDASSAREVVSLRGKPWAGGPLLFAEVAGEYWDLAIGMYHTKRSTYGRQAGHHMRTTALVAEESSRAPTFNDGAPAGDISLRDNSATVHDPQRKKKGGGTHKKYKKNRGSGPDGESLEALFKVNDKRADGQTKRTPPVDASKPAAESTFSATAAKSVDDQTKCMTGVDTGNMSQRVAGPLEPAVAIVGRDLYSSFVRSDNVDDESLIVGKAATAEEIYNSAVGKLSDDQVDGSFQTADGPHEDGKDAAFLDDSISVAAEFPTSSVSVEDAAPGDSVDMTVREGKESGYGTMATKSVENTDVSSVNPKCGHDSSALVPDTTAILTATQKTSEMCQPGARVDPSASKECMHASKPKRSVTVTIPPADTHAVAMTEKQEGDETMQSAQTRSVLGASVSETPTSAFVTAPSTPALAAPDVQVNPKKMTKLKGPAQTESLSLFAKPKRKSSSKKTKPAGRSSSRSMSANNSQPHGSTTHPPPHVRAVPMPAAAGNDNKKQDEVEDAVASAAAERDENADDGIHDAVVSAAGDDGSEACIEYAMKSAAVEDENKPNTPDDSDVDVGTSSHSSHDTLPGSTWTANKIAGTFRAIIAMTPSLSPVPHVMKSFEISVNNDLLPEKTLDGQIPILQLNELDEDEDEAGPKLEKVQDVTEPLNDESGTGLGISDEITLSDTASENVQSPGSDESKPKKKKAKGKGKSKSSKATASVTITSNITVSPKSNEPIHEFKGNDANSDTSSQTLGRTSPSSKRPSLKQVDEAKQPKPLLEPRPSRQIRNKKHTSSHGSKTDDANSIEETAVATVESPATLSQNLTVILTPCGDGTYLEEQSESMTVDDHAPMPFGTPKSIPTPEKPYDKLVAEDVPSPSVEQSIQRIREMDIKAAEKRKFA